MTAKTWRREQADRRALDLGACQARKSFYPSCVPSTWDRQKQVVFAVYYFGADGLEICHWIPDTATFVVLPAPREWHPSFLVETLPVPFEAAA